VGGAPQKLVQLSSTVAKACGSELTWGACNTQCGHGTQQRLTACSGADLTLEAPIPPESLVSWAMCLAPSSTLTWACFGAAGCAGFGWRCRTSTEALALCIDTATGANTVGFGGYSSSCGAGVSTRTVVCSILSAQGAPVLALGAADDSPCTARAPKPAASIACRSYACPQAAWRCYQLSSDPAVGVPCTGVGSDEATFACPTAGCRAAEPARARGVACYDVATGMRVSDSACTVSVKPPSTTSCLAMYHELRKCLLKFFSDASVTSHALLSMLTADASFTPR